MDLSLAIQYLHDALSDEGAAFGNAELARLVALGVSDYSEYAPYTVEYALATTTPTLTYTLPADTIDVLNVQDTTPADVAFRTFNDQIRLATDPGTTTLTVLLVRAHQPDVDGDYPTIPSRHLRHVGDFALARALYRVSDDISRRPAIQDGQTREDFGSNAADLALRADRLKMALHLALVDTTVVVG